MSNNNYHQITVMERFDQSKMSFNCPHCCSNISYSMVWQAIFNLNIPFNLTLYALAHSWTSFEKSDGFWINSDKFHGNRGTFKKIIIVNTYKCKNSKNICWANQSISNIIRWVAGLLGLSFHHLMVQYFNNFCKILLTI